MKPALEMDALPGHVLGNRSKYFLKLLLNLCRDRVSTACALRNSLSFTKPVFVRCKEIKDLP